MAADRSAERLAAVYRAAERELRQLIRAAALRGASGTEGYYRRQLRAVGAVQARLRAANRALVPASAREPFAAAVELAGGAEGLRGRFSGVDEGAVAALAAALDGRLTGSVVTVGREADDALRRAQLEEVAVGVAAGLTRRATSARLRRRLADEGTTGLVDRGGRRWRLGTYATMAVRTTARQAATAGTVAALRAAGEDLIAVSQHAGSCPVCLPFQGRTYSLGGRTPGYPRAVRLPPFHPNCRHVAAPSTASLERFEAELLSGRA